MISVAAPDGRGGLLLPEDAFDVWELELFHNWLMTGTVWSQADLEPLDLGELGVSG